MSGEITKPEIILGVATWIDNLYKENQEMKELLKDIDNSEEDLCCLYCGAGNHYSDGIKERIDKFING